MSHGRGCSTGSVKKSFLYLAYRVCGGTNQSVFAHIVITEKKGKEALSFGILADTPQEQGGLDGRAIKLFQRVVVISGLCVVADRHAYTCVWWVSTPVLGYR